MGVSTSLNLVKRYVLMNCSGSIPYEDGYGHLAQDAPASVIVRFPAGISFISLHGLPVAGDLS